MEQLQKAWEYARQPYVWQQLMQQCRQHVGLVAVVLTIVLLLGLPLGLLSARVRSISTTVLNLVNALRVVPSLALMFVCITIPGLGLSNRTAVLALTVLALPPIVVNTDAAFRNLSPAILEAARGMGMAPAQSFWRVEVPLALPVVMTGIRTALIEVIASATLAAYIGAGGLGNSITLGISLNKPEILLAGAVPIALLAVGAELVMSLLQRWLQPPSHAVV